MRAALAAGDDVRAAMVMAEAVVAPVAAPGYVARLRGRGLPPPPRKPASTIAVNFVMSFCGMLLLSAIHFEVLSQWLDRQDLVLLIGSQGATAVLVFAATDSPLAQPANVVGGNLLSGFVGVAVQRVRAAAVVDASADGSEDTLDLQWLAVPLAVSLAILAMDCSRTLHPPGGATALIAVIGSDKIKALGWWYGLMPATMGAALLVLAATLGNNVWPTRPYPRYLTVTVLKYVAIT